MLSILARFSSNILATTILPSLAARWNGVFPCWQQIHRYTGQGTVTTYSHSIPVPNTHLVPRIGRAVLVLQQDLHDLHVPVQCSKVQCLSFHLTTQ